SSGVAAVGLTGADARCGLSRPAPAPRTGDGREGNLGRVGLPADDADPRVLRPLVAGGFAPGVAGVGGTATGGGREVNADTLAAHLAGRVGARRLVVAGTTPGVLGPTGNTIPLVDSAAAAALVASGTASAGMIAKLRACEHALAAGVDEVVIVDGRD